MLRLPREPNGNEPIRAADFRLLLRALRSVIPSSSSSVRVQTTGSGTTYHVDPAGAANAPAAAANFPFKVNVINNGDSTYKAWINYDSSLLGYSLDPAARIAITGLGKSAAFNLDGQDFIYLEVPCTGGGSVTGGTIKSWGMGGGGDVWTPGTEPGDGAISYVDYTTQADGGGGNLYTQTFFRIRIAQTAPDPKTGAPILRQLLNQNLMLWPILAPVGAVMQYAIPCGFSLYLNESNISESSVAQAILDAQSGVGPTSP